MAQLPNKPKPSVTNLRVAKVNSQGIPYPNWHPKNPKNAIVVPQSVAPTSGG